MGVGILVGDTVGVGAVVGVGSAPSVVKFQEVPLVVPPALFLAVILQ